MRVTDTASFIAKGKQIHGDKYDYTMSVFVASQKPIEIGCKRCGQVFKMAQAGSHYRAKRPCGCRSCTIEQSVVSRGLNVKRCKECDCRIKNTTKTRCKKCGSEWSVWAKKQNNADRRRRKRVVKEHTPWGLWAINKVTNHWIRRSRICHQRKAIKAKPLSDWNDWASKALNKPRGEETAWQRRARAWARSLSKRVAKRS